MRAYTCFVILAVVSSPAHIFANEAPSEVDKVVLAATPLCFETVCPRLYMPVCAIVDGEQVTLPSRCVLDNKIRCAAALQQSSNQKGPSVRFLHSGSCSLKADKRIVKRMTRDMPIESDEEIVEVPNEEIEGAHKEEEGANGEVDGANGEEEGANGEVDGANREVDGENKEVYDANVEEESAHEEDNGVNEEEAGANGAEAGAIEEEHDASNDKIGELSAIHNSDDSGESGEVDALQLHNINELEHLEDQADLDDNQAEADDAEAERDHAEELEDEE